MSRFLSGGPITSVEVHERGIEKAVERALAAALEGLPLLGAVRAGTNPEPVSGGVYDENDVYTAYEIIGDPIGVNPLSP